MLPQTNSLVFLPEVSLCFVFALLFNSLHNIVSCRHPAFITAQGSVVRFSNWLKDWVGEPGQVESSVSSQRFASTTGRIQEVFACTALNQWKHITPTCSVRTRERFWLIYLSAKLGTPGGKPIQVKYDQNLCLPADHIYTLLRESNVQISKIEKAQNVAQMTIGTVLCEPKN